MTAIHFAILSAEMSVVLWALSDRRRPIRLYPQLIREVESGAESQLFNVAESLGSRIVGAADTLAVVAAGTEGR